MSECRNTVAWSITGVALGLCLYNYMDGGRRKHRCGLEDGIRKAADELQGVSEELGRAIRSIGASMAR